MLPQMPTERRSVLAVALASLTAVLVVSGLLLLLLTLDQPPRGGWGFRGFPTIFAIGAGAMGWLIMVRRPDNRIGLVLAIIGSLNAGQLFLTEYAAIGTRQPVPAANLAAWINSWIWVPTLGLMAGGVPLLFPDGRLPSPRWRAVAGLLVGASLALIAIITANPGALDTLRVVQRLVTLPVDDATLNGLSYAALLALAAGISASAASLILRWRRAAGVVREQLKWLALSVALVVATMWLAVVPSALAVAIFIGAIGMVPLAIGIAILRHRLYDIDSVINRTLVFGVLTAILTGGFAALLKLMQSIFVAVTGNESDAATVITTLILATAFVPLKKSIEGLVERRVGSHLAGASAVDTPTAPPAELEPMLRRVVREEVRAALEASKAEESPST